MRSVLIGFPVPAAFGSRRPNSFVSREPWIDQGGRDALELLWEDKSDEPFVLHLVAEQTDRLIPDTQQGGGFVVTAWTRAGQKGRWPRRYRTSVATPILSPGQRIKRGL